MAHESRTFKVCTSVPVLHDFSHKIHPRPPLQKIYLSQPQFSHMNFYIFIFRFLKFWSFLLLSIAFPHPHFFVSLSYHNPPPPPVDSAVELTVFPKYTPPPLAAEGVWYVNKYQGLYFGPKPFIPSTFPKRILFHLSRHVVFRLLLWTFCLLLLLIYFTLLLPVISFSFSFIPFYYISSLFLFPPR